MKLQDQKRWKAIIFPKDYLKKGISTLPDEIINAILNLEVQRYNTTGTYIIMKGEGNGQLDYNNKDRRIRTNSI